MKSCKTSTCMHYFCVA